MLKLEPYLAQPQLVRKNLALTNFDWWHHKVDIRLARILAERGSNHPEAVALRRLMAASRRVRGRMGRIKYRRPQDLARLPRNPSEAEARQDLSLRTAILPAIVPKITRMIEKQVYLRLKLKKEYEEYLRAKAAAEYAKYYEEFFRA